MAGAGGVHSVEPHQVASDCRRIDDRGSFSGGNRADDRLSAAQPAAQRRTKSERHHSAAEVVRVLDDCDPLNGAEPLKDGVEVGGKVVSAEAPPRDDVVDPDVSQTETTLGLLKRQ
jgi:hypothetical protein